MGRLWPVVMAAVGWWMAGSGQAAGQSAPARTTDFPAKPDPGQWHFDQTMHKAWHYHDDAWQPFPCNDCRSMTFCNGHVILKNGFSYMLADAAGRVVVAKAPEIKCMDGFVIVSNVNRINYLIDQSGDTVSALVNNCRISRDTVRGEGVYCFPQYIQGLERYNCFDLKNWGMMNATGQWLIEPQFDKPFHFEDGVARVVFKGQHYEIDEQGNFTKVEEEE